MSAQYTNLEWAIEGRGLDLKQLSEQAESRLFQACKVKRILDALSERMRKKTK